MRERLQTRIFLRFSIHKTGKIVIWLFN